MYLDTGCRRSVRSLTPCPTPGSIDATTSGSAARWHLSLTPKDARLRRHVASIEVDGSASAARCFSILDADGDARIMLVEALASAQLPKPLTRHNVEVVCRSAGNP